MRTAPESRKIGSIIKAVRDKTLIPKPNFQRRSVWTSRDKIAFIETILSGYPFPEIYVASGSMDTSSGEATEVLVDGQQRVRTMDEYFRGVPPFRTSRGIRKYKDLSEPEKLSYLNYDVAVRNLGLLSEPELVEVFRRMNATSYDLNEIERYNAVYLGEFKKFAESMAQNDFFVENRLFSAADIRRMKDVSYVISLATTMMSGYFHREEKIETYLEEYNDDFPSKEILIDRFHKVFDFLDLLALGRNSRAWNKADFYTLFVELDRALYKEGRVIGMNALESRLSEFYDAVDAARDAPPSDEAVKSYYEATRQNTADRHQRIARADQIRILIEACSESRLGAANDGAVAP